MANQSFIAVPPNLEDAVVLRRFLSKLVEQVDVIAGNRADAAYVEETSLLTAANVLKTQLETATEGLTAALEALELLDETTVEDILQQIQAEREKNVDQDDRLDNLQQLAAIKGCVYKFTVDALGDQVPLVNFNVVSNSHPAIGEYEIELDTKTFEGVDVVTNSVASSSYRIAASVNTSLFRVRVVPQVATGFLRILVDEVAATGANLGYTPYNLAINDVVEVTLILTLPGATLPTGF